MVNNFILSSNVFHKRHLPKENTFNYKSYYVVLDMLDLNSSSNILGINKFNIFSFYDTNHGYKNGSKSVTWAINLFDKNYIEYDNIKLITMPSIFGYLFNPISFWLAYKDDKLRCIICEVNNTFGETHSYICHKDGREVTTKCWFKANKSFHVSPFYDRKGYYKFNFNIDFNTDKKSKIIINYYDNDQLQLSTLITSKSKRLSSLSLLHDFFRVPLLTFKIIFLIHYQAIKLILKKIKYVPKPSQKDYSITIANYINKN